MFSKKDLYKLIIPLVIEQILAVTIGMADTVMVSSVGEAAVSGISLVDTVNILLINLFSALATGGAVVAAQYLGRRDMENARTAAKQLLLAITILSVVIMLIPLIGNEALLGLLFGNIEPAVRSNAEIYFQLSAVSYPFLAIFNAGAALFRSMGNSRVSMLTAVVMNVLNLGGNAILIFGFQMGVAGAAVASLVARVTGAVIMLVLLKNNNNPLQVDSYRKWNFHWKMIKNILHIGVPNGLENGLFQVGKIMVQGLIASYGTASLAANAIANPVAAMEVIPGTAIGLAMITVVGQCVGAGDYEQAKKYAKKLMVITYITMGFLDVILLLLTAPIVGFYGMSAETSRLATELLLLHGVCAILIWPSSFTLPNALRAANDVKFTMITSIVSMWTFRIVCSYLLGSVLGMGVLGVWIAMIIDWVFRAACFLFRFYSGKWQNKKLI